MSPLSTGRDASSSPVEVPTPPSGTGSPPSGTASPVSPQPVITSAYPLRRPRVGGVAGGVGTSTIAALLSCDDAGVLTAPGTEPVDALVCRSTASSVRAAIAVAAQMTSPPVLVVVADCPAKIPTNARHRLRMADPNLAAVVYVPWWAALRDADDPARHIAAQARAPRAVKAARSVHTVFDQLVAAITPLLTSSSPPTPTPTVH